MNTLYAIINGTHVGTFKRKYVDKRNHKESLVTFQYSPHYKGSPISLSLPLNSKWVKKAPENYLKNLLPSENVSARLLAQSLGDNSDDWFSWVGSLGTDVAGALTITPDINKTYRELDVRRIDTQLESYNRYVSTTKLVGTAETRMSLAGAQSKFSGRLIGKSFVSSTYSYPTTHIIKPPSKLHPKLPQYELLGVNLAKSLGIRSSNSIITPLNGTEEYIYITERFDRFFQSSKITRRPMEDMSQVLGISPDKKYNNSWKQLFYLLRNTTSEKELNVLISQIIFNKHIGNSDAHLKNYSIFLDTLEITPLYDAVPTVVYDRGKTKMALPLPGTPYVTGLTKSSWVAWAKTLHLDVDLVIHQVEFISSGILENIDKVSKLSYLTHFDDKRNLDLIVSLSDKVLEGK